MVGLRASDAVLAASVSCDSQTSQQVTIENNEVIERGKLPATH